ncbi:glucan endo-1,3-beta-glucosidase 4-like [Mercurialis annua]|uniref:glucan endo-1,3-beta-glucosidase 4-like n=1 Tax=Mercurialis annua TaxID=3986 RepID=UPI0024ACF7CB|nr:glucan endo-1,3-beta-glucosidase 4-like [Mercurialis annua]
MEFKIYIYITYKNIKLYMFLLTEMAKLPISTSILFLLILLSIHSGEISLLVEAQKTWCVAKPTTTDIELQNNLDYACSHADCRSLRNGNACYSSNSRLHQASYAMNQYYQSHGRIDSSCDFSNTGLIAVSDPSYGNCIFDYGGNEPLAAESNGWCVAKPMAPPELLLANINYVCGEIECSIIQANGDCYSPDNILSHASIAMNMYYVIHNKTNLSCYFNNSGIVVLNDPSYGICDYY